MPKGEIPHEDVVQENVVEEDNESDGQEEFDGGYPPIGSNIPLDLSEPCSRGPGCIYRTMPLFIIEKEVHVKYGNKETDSINPDSPGYGDLLKSLSERHPKIHRYVCQYKRYLELHGS